MERYVLGQRLVLGAGRCRDATAPAQVAIRQLPSRLLAPVVTSATKPTDPRAAIDHGGTKIMTTKAQRIAIAEACGWILDSWRCADGGRRWIKGELYAYENDIGDGRTLPDYPGDLNAMHEAEKRLNAQQQDVFAAYLGGLTGGRQIDFGAARINCSTKILFATAAQRAEAFLRTLDKWEDDS
jgi:hypothetical protein